ncbi:hypothetical protein [Kocuria aegyptia]|uniref:Uncharacterized protein n=1 Tax=Kocuria aegyptia TaxID=330943 RepID=A0ABP4X8G4_9MICC
MVGRNGSGTTTLLSIIGSVVATLAVLVRVTATAPGSGAADGAGAAGLPEGLVLLPAPAAPVLLALLGRGPYHRISVR